MSSFGGTDKGILCENNFFCRQVEVKFAWDEIKKNRIFVSMI